MKPVLIELRIGESSRYAHVIRIVNSEGQRFSILKFRIPFSNFFRNLVSNEITIELKVT